MLTKTSPTDVTSGDILADCERQLNMRFGTKLVLSLALVVLLAGIVALSLLAFLRINDAALAEMRASYDQTLAIKTIESAANDYSEQIAELLILGPEPSQVETARDVLLGAIGTMEASVHAEIEALLQVDDFDEVREEEAELMVMAELRGIIQKIEAMRTEIGSALTNQDQEKARRIYRDDVEHRLDDALDHLLAASVTREIQEVGGAIASMDVLIERMRASAYGLVAVMALLVVLLGVFFFRSVLRPVEALSKGTDAVANGDLGYRVQIRQRDELGRLADQFNAMTDKIAQQRDALLTAKSGLEAEVAARTVELEEAATRHKELAEGRARVLADLSHELRTPLTVIRGKAEIALSDPDATAAYMRTALERVRVKAEQMSRLVDDMLFVARSEAGAIPIERQRINMQDVLADTLLDSEELSRRKDIAIRPHQPTEPVVVRGDAERLRQAILIPLDNAVRIAPAGSVVHVDLTCEQDRAVVKVSDHGPGFAAEETERAFSRFWRGPARGGKSARGSGLGLAIARWIMEQHDGTITIENHSEGGATVRLDMPFDAEGMNDTEATP
ncbi:HAMP domain-containing histidine kinase [Tateyamaria omphalii]|uniref:sensor histidine kinase n=1 Tax=Tateyamaria omphalii TaxID=299262 RepID=UPI001C995B38|nr:HAMP domain-containing sensor histidine kinase [Tateyamaria omphalii]MBY5935108.1 HAMP domain-containing histidine kinase [Tateyamaria omphalii]